jgi:lipopolysaccharide/colanic/teichoic acid biosynthesis glycosyltransferase
MDLVAAVLLLALASPLILIVAAAVRLSSPGPILFRQKRAGLGGSPFAFLKFRTMRVNADAEKPLLLPYNEQSGPVFKMAHDPRVTAVGRILRKTSIDELPQLWNVIRGEMSLVGPRPPTLDEVARYAPWQMKRLSVTPGVTCIWQVSGRSEVGFEEWVRMDIRYSRTRSLLLDLALLLRTLPAVLSGRGAH